MRDRCIVALLGGGFDDASLLVGLYRRSRIGAAPTRLGQLRMLVTKPFEYGRKSAQFVRDHGPAIRSQYGVSPLQQFLALYSGWLEGTARPDQLAAYWAFNVRRPRKWGAWITGVQANVLLGGLAERRAPELARLIGDKRYFAAWGAERGLPTLPVLAAFESGAPVGRTAEGVADGLPAVDLFAKPADLWSGQGTRRWRVAAEAPPRWHDEQGREVGARDIVAALAAQSAERPLVLQRCLHPHPGMVHLTPDAISTVRCVTYEDTDGSPRLLGAGIRIPMPGMIVDNMNAGGMVATIDSATGRLSQGIGWRENGLLERSSTLLGSAVRVEGEEIALWPEVRRIALEAQRATGLPFVGWDVALCEGGPILLEANIRWGGALLTFGSLSPLTDTDFPAVYMHHWARGPGQAP